MAIAALSSSSAHVMNLGSKGLHPFFSKPKDAYSNNNDEYDTPAANGNTGPLAAVDQEKAEVIDSKPKGKLLKGRKPGRTRKSKIPGESTCGQTTLGQYTQHEEHPLSLDEVPAGSLPGYIECIEAQAAELEPDPNLTRRKRRKLSDNDFDAERSALLSSVSSEGENGVTLQSSSPSWRDQLEAAANENADNVLVRESSPMQFASHTESLDTQVIPSTPRRQHLQPDPASSPSLPATPPAAPSTGIKESKEKSRTPKKKKMLRLNPSGKFSSPISNAQGNPTEANSRMTRAARKRKSKTTEYLVVIAYGKDAQSQERIGRRIESLLANSHDERLPTQAAKPSVHKITHPFFRAKDNKHSETKPADVAVPAQGSQAVPPSPRRSAVTPGKLRAQAKAQQSDGDVDGAVLLYRRSNIIKHPGAREPPWPWQHAAHCRNAGEVSPKLPCFTHAVTLDLKRMKGATLSIQPDEDLITSLAQSLCSISLAIDYDDFGFRRPPAALRIPERLLTNGDAIVTRVRAQLSGDTLEHPAIQNLLSGIATTMTAFDLGKCENMGWAAKYAPSTIECTLQSNKVTRVMRHWLQSLQVQSVDTGTKDTSSGSPKKKRSEKPPKKRRKKLSDIDDFVVASDDDADNGDELSEPEDDDDVGDRTDQSRSWVRSSTLSGGARVTKVRNIILISGPHGCGKTASVYAAAKELGFEVFEINASSRRAGKDLMEKIGDMTENHLVNHRQTNGLTAELTPATIDSDSEKLSEALHKDIASGRQGTMTAFFKSNQSINPRPKKSAPSNDIAKAKGTKPSKQMEISRRPGKSQKQSLILLEEVDLLFNDDKGFWPTVVELASHSRRPVVLTCTDEHLVPFPDLAFEAILRFTSPPIKLATDYLLLVAAKEGHHVSREAIQALYKSKGHDLRASITELDFWCQMAVGDRKGGLDWIYQRWPPGKDVDVEGKTIRVASGSTYQTGMGWVSRDIAYSHELLSAGKDEELQLQLWDDWNIDPQAAAARPAALASLSSQSDDWTSLCTIDAAADALSAADVFCKIGVPQTRPSQLDATQPTMPETHVSDYTTGYTLLQTDYEIDFGKFDERIAITAQRMAELALQSSSGAQFPDTSTLESGVVESVLGHKRSPPKNNYRTKMDFVAVFDALTVLPPTVLWGGPTPRASFNRPFDIITTDLAPYIRCICASDLRLEAQRDRLSGLLAAGSKPGKRRRTTRASRSALEGGRRENTRKERWFYKDLNYKSVMATAGEAWAGACVPSESSCDISEVGSQSQDVSMTDEDAKTPRIDEEE